MNLDERLDQASTDIHRAVRGREPKPIAAVARHHNMMRFAVASTAVVTVTAAVGLTAVADSGSSFQPLASQSTPSDATTTTTQQPLPASGSVAPVELSTIDVSAAVAPFDHESSVESVLLEVGIESVWSERLSYISACMADAGFDGPEPVVLPSRDDPILISNWQFPPTDLLAASGFVFLPGEPAGPNELSPNDYVEDPARDAAAAACSTEEASLNLDSDRTRASELYGDLRGAWERVLTDIDNSAEVQMELAGFSACLVDNDIPAQYTTSLERYLGYVDSLLMTAGDIDDYAEMRAIDEKFGKLYAECGRDLFETREQLRSGERRTDFLDDHAEEISELKDLIGASH